MPKAKAVCVGLYTYSSGFVEAWKRFVKVWQQPLLQRCSEKKIHSKIFKIVAGKKMTDEDKSS